MSIRMHPMSRRLCTSLGIVAALALVPLTYSIAQAARNPSDTVDATCSAAGSSFDQAVPFIATGPDSAEPNATITLVLEPVQASLPASQSGVTINNYRDLTTSVDITGGTVIGATSSGGANLGPGTVSTPVTASGAKLIIPGPIPGGATITTPRVEISITTGASGSVVLKPASPFYQVTASTSFGDFPASCTAKDPAQGTVTVPTAATGPTVTLNTPSEGSVYLYQQAVNASYSCTNAVSCVGDVPDGSPIDTNTPGAHQFTVTATDGGGATAVKSVNYTVLAPGQALPSYVRVTPIRVLDTRSGGKTADGQFSGTGLAAAGSVIELQIGGRVGVPNDAAGVALNLTITDSQGAGGFLTVWPCGSPRPNGSSLNYSSAGDSRANLVVAKLGTGGKVCVFAGVAGTQVVADVSGFFPAGSQYTSLNPARLLDTRKGTSTVDGVGAGGGAAAAGSTTQVKVAGRGGVPADARTVVLNVTATDTQGWGFVTVYPCDSPRPNASSVNYTAAGQTSPNAVITKLDGSGNVCLYTGVVGTELIVDASGFFPGGAEYISVNPERLLDTRAGASTIDGTSAGGGLAAAGSTVELQLGGRASVPADATAVVINVTATETLGAGGFVTVFPCGTDRPQASSLNFSAADQTRPNSVIAKVGMGGKVCLYVGVAGTHLIVDVNGYFPAPTAPSGSPVDPGNQTTTTTTTTTTIPTTTTTLPLPPPVDLIGISCGILLGAANGLAEPMRTLVLTLLDPLCPAAIP